VNVIFDLGGVVVTWDPLEFIYNTVENKQKQQILRTEMVNHPDWIDLDRGILTMKDAVTRGAKRTALSEAEIQQFLEAVPPFLNPIPESIQLVKELKKNGNKLYVLSNLHIASINYLEREHSFLDLFDGKVISCRINKVKPEPGIYQHLLDIYNLDIGETVFIDDVEINTDAAADLGMMTIKFENPDQCRAELVRLGCL
jgi:putative hydrolase of the HAD superfamily